MSDQVIDADVVEENDVSSPQPGTLIPAAPTLAVAPTVSPSDLKCRLDAIQEAQRVSMVKDVDYGVIPGTDKPTLYKPGAEKLSVLFQLDVQLANEKEWGPGEHLTVVSKATVFHAPTGSRLGYGEGICTTRERKYAYRKKNRTCPKCGAEAIIKGKEEFGGGWVCWKKREGCDAKFPDGDKSIEGQEAGEVDNPDLPDLWNTVVKMAEKRARVDAILAVTGASALFTQDVEDMGSGTVAGDRSPHPANSSAPAPATGFASDRQRGFAERLLKEAGFHEAGTFEVLEYMGVDLSRSDISKTIDGLKEDATRAETADRLGKAAKEFAVRHSTETPDLHEPEQTSKSDQDIPF